MTRTSRRAFLVGIDLALVVVTWAIVFVYAQNVRENNALGEAWGRYFVETKQINLLAKMTDNDKEYPVDFLDRESAARWADRMSFGGFVTLNTDVRRLRRDLNHLDAQLGEAEKGLSYTNPSRWVGRNESWHGRQANAKQRVRMRRPTRPRREQERQAERADIERAERIEMAGTVAPVTP